MSGLNGFDGCCLWSVGLARLCLATASGGEGGLLGTGHRPGNSWWVWTAVTLGEKKWVAAVGRQGGDGWGGGFFFLSSFSVVFRTEPVSSY